MKQVSNISLWLTRIAWALIVFDLFFIVAIAGIDYANALFYFAVIWICLIFILIAASTWLIIYYRAFFRTWFGWLLSFVVLFLSGLAVQVTSSIDSVSLACLSALMFLVSLWGIIPITIIYQWYSDVGLRLIAWGSIIVVWTFTLAWCFQGNLIEVFLRNFFSSAQPLELWWLSPVICIMWWLIPVGVISFLGHTVRLIVQEFVN